MEGTGNFSDYNQALPSAQVSNQGTSYGKDQGSLGMSGGNESHNNSFAMANSKKMVH